MKKENLEEELGKLIDNKLEDLIESVNNIKTTLKETNRLLDETDSLLDNIDNKLDNIEGILDEKDN